MTKCGNALTFDSDLIRLRFGVWQGIVAVIVQVV